MQVNMAQVKNVTMAPPNYKCGRSVKDVGKFTEGEKKILYCKNNQYPCTKCKNKKD